MCRKQMEDHGTVFAPVFCYQRNTEFLSMPFTVVIFHYLGKIKKLQWFGSLILISTLVMTWEMLDIERLIPL